MKSEPDVYSIHHLEKDGSTLWEGVRNYLARNYMMTNMKDGDQVFFYHSNATPSGIVGLGRVEAPAVPDPTQFSKKSEYYDAKATLAKPRWYCVRVHFQKKAKRELSLAEIKADPELQKMLVALPGQRLSIMPVSADHAELILKKIF